MALKHGRPQIGVGGNIFNNCITENTIILVACSGKIKVLAIYFPAVKSAFLNLKQRSFYGFFLCGAIKFFSY